eukprot:g1525.t1
MTEIFRVAYGLPIVGCMFFYGVQFVPAKLRSTYNGAVFQWFMSSGGLFVALILCELLSDEVPGGHYAGLLGGALVAVSNGIILHLKRRLGLFTSVVLYQAANLITGYCVGRFGLFNVPPDPGRRDFEGCDPETISLVIQETDPDDLFLNVQELRSSENQPDLQRAISDRIMRRRSEASQAALLFGVDEEEAGPGPSRRRSWPQLGHLPPGLPPGSPNPPRSSATSTPSVNQRRSSLQTVNLPERQGWLLAGVAGVCRGLNPVPFAMWHRTYPSTQSACFVFPMALGDVDTMLKEADLDSDGKINYEEIW